MKNLFLVDGVSGTGKTDLVEWVLNRHSDVDIVKKFTTREKRDYEKDIEEFLDLEFGFSKEKLKQLKLDYTYVYNNK